MVKARTSLRDGDTIGRLRRGFSSTQNSHPVDAMARASCFSRRQFHRLMVQVLGETPGTHQRRLRLDRWAWLLLISRATVLDVALETGFENHETFTRAFQTRFGVTPSAFRKNRGNTRCTFHRTADTSATAEGWRLLCQDGFKSWIERIK
jgi:AraC-like DNA-binding protein